MNKKLTKSQAVDAATHDTIRKLKQGGLTLSGQQETRLRLEISYALYNRKSASKITIPKISKTA